MQPRSEGHQRCLTFFLDVNPSTNVMLYRDYLGNTVHHFDITEAHAQLRVTAKAVVEVQPPPVPEPSGAYEWSALDSQVAQGDFWEMLLPSRFVRTTALLQKFASEKKLERLGDPLETLIRINEVLYATFEYVPRSTKVDSPIDDALKSRKGVCQDLAHIMIALGTGAADSLPLRQRIFVARSQSSRPLARGRDPCLDRSIFAASRMGCVRSYE